MRRRVVSLACLALILSCGGGSSAVTEAFAADDSVVMVAGAAQLIPVLANDAGLGSVEVVTAPPRGSATAEQNGRIRYEPEPGFNGTESFAYGARDRAGAMHTATVTVTVYEDAGPDAPMVLLPKRSLNRREVALLVNDNDPQSVAVAAYYAEQRRIPAGNVIHLAFAAGGAVMSATDFAPLYQQAEAAAGPDIQAYVLSWTYPYRVEGMSITSAFALGYDEKYFDTQPCNSTAFVDYFDSDSTQPFSDHGIRPTMMLAGETEDDVRALIDRGIAADGTLPTGTGYMVRTTDTARSVRYPSMTSALNVWNHAPDGLELTYVDNSDGSGSNTVQDATDVLFYLTGLATVPGIDTNDYLPGAVADHLTSFGGKLDSGGQMSVLRWLEAGATASFGTVIEPCNYTSKFPHPIPLFSRYYRGGTVLEAYWKSVAWPGEGIFVGEPLARPWGRTLLSYDGGTLTIQTTWLEPGQSYRLMAADSPEGPFEPASSGITVDHHQLATIELVSATRAVYRLEAD
jgi:uncharacterized protein (TIGR03790 family)